ncbi:unnamed protein product [Mytilus edulis]|uniref:FERM domain-containing protein n=1 Tax=Mytilus edulis TaxID=6550 RepID=A0A8S3VI75_MYTED|nr:unnamed protein product [Mytilus edulis]
MFRKNSKKGDPQVEYQCTIRFLDDSEPIQLFFKKDTLGHSLFDQVCAKLNLVEKDYFGLRYVDADKQRHWLDPLKAVYKQLKGRGTGSSPRKAYLEKMVYNAVNDYWKNILILEARTKVSMKMLNVDNFKVGVVHNIWESSGSELLSVKRACVKAKIISGTYTLQADRAKFNGNRTSSLCPLCFKQSEDLMHFLIKCNSLEGVRRKFIMLLRNLLNDKINALLVDDLFNFEDNLLQLIVDCTKFQFLKQLWTTIERLSSSLCFGLHQKRTSLLL